MHDDTQDRIRHVRELLKRAVAVIGKIDPGTMNETDAAHVHQAHLAFRNANRRLARIVDDLEDLPPIEYRNRETGELSELREARENWTDAGFEVDERDTRSDTWQPSNYRPDALTDAYWHGYASARASRRYGALHAEATEADYADRHLERLAFGAGVAAFERTS